MEHTFRMIFLSLGAVAGWLNARFAPTFPLLTVAVIFCVYDAWTAYQLDRRVHIAYPDKAKRREAKFTSFAFGKVVRKTIPNRLGVIILSFIADTWVWPLHNLYVAHMVTGIICFEQALSILENESSCRSDDDTKLWKALRAILVDKSKRHMEKLGVDISELTEGGGNDE